MQKGLALFAILGIMLFLALATGFVLVWRLFYIALFLSAASSVWALLSLRGIEVHLTPVPTPLQAGDSFDVEISVANRSRLPNFLVGLELCSGLLLDEDATSLTLAPRRRVLWHTRALCPRRGIYDLGPVAVSTGDPFGIFRRRRKLGGEQKIIVYPRTMELPYFAFQWK